MNWTCGHAWKKANLERTDHMEVNYLTCTDNHSQACSLMMDENRGMARAQVT